jgi:hypothetical protein
MGNNQSWDSRGVYEIGKGIGSTQFRVHRVNIMRKATKSNCDINLCACVGLNGCMIENRSVRLETTKESREPEVRLLV